MFDLENLESDRDLNSQLYDNLSHAVLLYSEEFFIAFPVHLSFTNLLNSG